MGLRFRKSVKIAPGVKVNFNKKSVGVSVGTKGAHVSVNSSGRKTTSVGIPGTGLSYVTTSSKSKQKSSRKAASSSENAQSWAAEERAAEYSKKAQNVKTNKTIIQVFGWILAVLFLILGLVYPVCFVFCALCVFAAIKARKSWRKTYDDLTHKAEEELTRADEEDPQDDVSEGWNKSV